MNHRLAFLAMALLAAPTLAGQIVVPTDYPTLDLAVMNALPGDIILVRTTATQPFITIDKSLTIIGEPIVNIDYACGLGPAPINLNGTGVGKVELVNFDVDRTVDCSNPTPGIRGGGFTELVLQNCNIPPTAAGRTGLGNGAAGISVSVSNLIVQSCFIAGKGPDGDHCAGFLFPGREAGIFAPGAHVLVLDSTVRGGDGGYLCCDSCTCPTLSGLGGEGGEGIVCESLYIANSTVSHGRGSNFFANNGGSTTFCGRQPDGMAFDVNLFVRMANDLVLTGPVRIGQTYQVSWTSSGPATTLYLGFGVRFPAAYYPGLGWGFGDSTSFPLATFFGGGVFSLNLPVPPNPALLGADIVFQLVDTTDGISRPVTALIEN